MPKFTFLPFPSGEGQGEGKNPSKKKKHHAPRHFRTNAETDQPNRNNRTPQPISILVIRKSSATMRPSFFQYWGKADEKYIGTTDWHPLPFCPPFAILPSLCHSALPPVILSEAKNLAFPWHVHDAVGVGQRVKGRTFSPSPQPSPTRGEGGRWRKGTLPAVLPASPSCHPHHPFRHPAIPSVLPAVLPSVLPSIPLLSFPQVFSGNPSSSPKPP